MELSKDTPTAEAEHTHPADVQQTGSGSAQSPGGVNAPSQTIAEMSHGGEAYPGPRDGGETDMAGETTAGNSTDAGDVDPDGTHSADETGQAGDPTDPAKNKAHPWNG